MERPPFDPVGLDHLVLYVNDLDAATRWYEEVLGCTRGVDYPEIAMRHLWFGAILIGLWDLSDPRAAYARPAVAGGRNVDHIALATGPFDPAALLRHRARHGLTPEQHLIQTGARGLGHAIYIRDPWGNRIEIKGPARLPDGREVRSGDPTR